MNTRLHKLARTKPAVCAEMAADTDSVAVIACRHSVSELTARKWQERSSSHDRSHTARKLHFECAAQVVRHQDRQAIDGQRQRIH